MCQLSAEVGLSGGRVETCLRVVDGPHVLCHPTLLSFCWRTINSLQQASKEEGAQRTQQKVHLGVLTPEIMKRDRSAGGSKMTVTYLLLSVSGEGRVLTVSRFCKVMCAPLTASCGSMRRYYL